MRARGVVVVLLLGVGALVLPLRQQVQRVLDVAHGALGQSHHALVDDLEVD